MKVLFVAGFGPIVPDMNSARAFYGDALGLPLEGDASYLSTTDVAGVKHFALWPLSGAAQSCCGHVAPGVSGAAGMDRVRRGRRRRGNSRA